MMIIRKMVWYSILALTLISMISQITVLACPGACICKWKGGKQTVECRNQGLSSLPDDISSETQVLDISGNKLRILPRGAFSRAGLLNLQRIHLRNSKLSQIDSGAFNELINLVEIDLSENLLTSVPRESFKSTPFLRELNLAGNPLVHIRNGDFEFVPQLVKLDLSGCQLVTIHNYAFNQLSLLESLKINSNQLNIISNSTVKLLSQLHGVELHDNPWECDCRLRDLKILLQTRNIPHPISPLCFTPPRLRGKRFSDLNITEFACPPRILPQTDRFVRIYEGENATLRCLVDSIPVTSIRWFIGGRPIMNNTLVSPNRKFIIYEDELGSVLVLTNALRKDSGDFFCMVENPSGLIEANFTLEVAQRLPFPTLDSTNILLISLAVLGVILLLFAGLLLSLWRRQRRSADGKKPVLGRSSSGNPVKPPRISSYEINPGSLVSNGGASNGFKIKNHGGEQSTDNPDLILETTNNSGGTYQDTGLEDHSSNSELNWEQQSYRNLGYATEYPPDYGLPIIHENSVYSESASYYNVGMGLNGTAVMSGLWNKNKVGARITAPSARDSPDEGYQEGTYCGTDV